MKKDVIDLSSDGEDGYENIPDIKLSGLHKQIFCTRPFDAGGITNNDPSGRARADGSLLRNSLQGDHCVESMLVQESRILREGLKVEEMTAEQCYSTTHNVLGASTYPSPATVMQRKQVSRRFWKAGDYEVQASSSRAFLNGMDHVRVHPKFLHSNATSHKWALGAIAELLDNAIDEVSNGATFVSVDKVTNPCDNSPALLVQDDGGGMDPDGLRHCMSLGYSRKSSNTTIGQYGNGFKTSTMRLGADVIVFSRCLRDRCATQSVGMLSYTFLRATGHEDIVVPMVDFELSQGDGKAKMLARTNGDDWLSNLSFMLQWSPYMTESALLKQFDDIGPHGTKIIVYNLWMNDDDELELDFDTDKQDIQVKGAPKLDKSDSVQKQLTNQHIVTRLRFSLRAYASILYLKMPSNFQIILRGKVVEHLSIADDLKFAERILYKPQIGNSRDLNCKEVSVITTIGFAKEAPMVSVHGFNVYHKNRLIMPFWKVVQENSSRGRGVVGVLEANFIEPAHDKQDFERTPMLQRLETRLKQMTLEYWNLHCELIGYQPPKQPNKNRVPSGLGSSEGHTVLNTQTEGKQGETSAPSTPPQPGSDAVCNQAEAVLRAKDSDCGVVVVDGTTESTKIQQSIGGKKYHDLQRISVSELDCPNSVSSKRAAEASLLRPSKHQAIVPANNGIINAPVNSNFNIAEVIEELEQLRARCADYRCREEEFKLKIAELESELIETKHKYRALVGKQPELKRPKEEF